MRTFFRPTVKGSAWAGFACGAALLTGCGEPQIPPISLVTVQGKILVGDQPVKSGTVSFRPDAVLGNKTMQQPAAAIQVDGSVATTSNKSH